VIKVSVDINDEWRVIRNMSEDIKINTVTLKNYEDCKFCGVLIFL